MNLDWIYSNTEKATRIKHLLKEEFTRTPAEYDFFLGCYGNPDAEVVLVPEIPSLTAKEIVAEAYCKQPERLWTTAWKVTVPDLLFRIALYRNGMIDDPLSDSPWDWKCWVTDFVKHAEYTKSWKHMDKNERTEEIKRSAKVLGRELEILNQEPNPIRCVIFVGKKSESYFQDYLEGPNYKWQFNRKSVKHYAWAKSEEQREMFFNEFEKAIKGCCK